MQAAGFVRQAKFQVGFRGVFSLVRFFGQAKK
jgi:hypothetical protein